jgi:hypothetical protein
VDAEAPMRTSACQAYEGGEFRGRLGGEEEEVLSAGQREKVVCRLILV